MRRRRNLLAVTLLLGACGRLWAGPAEPGRPALDWELNDPQGQTHRLSDARGSVVVMEFWATWSEPSIASLPEMEKLSKQFAPKGVQFLAIHCKEANDPVEAFKRAGVSYPLLLEGTAVAARYGVTRLPTLVVVDTKGLVTFRATGFGTGASEILAREIHEALGETAAPALAGQGVEVDGSADASATPPAGTPDANDKPPR